MYLVDVQRDHGSFICKSADCVGSQEEMSEWGKGFSFAFLGGKEGKQSTVESGHLVLLRKHYSRNIEWNVWGEICVFEYSIESHKFGEMWKYAVPFTEKLDFDLTRQMRKS